MRFIEPNEPGSQETLRQENQELKRQLQELRGLGNGHGGLPAKIWHPSSLTIWSIFLGVIVLLALAFLAGYVPLQKRDNLIRSEAKQQEQTLPRVEVIQVGRSARNSQLQLPGSVQAITEAPILARATGYIQRRMVDIGDRVRTGQTLVEIEAPELD